MKRILVLAAAAGLSAMALHAGDSSKTTGYISDAMCAGKHANTNAGSAECVKKCIAGGEKPVFVDDSKKEVWAIDNPDAVKDFYGSHVAVTADVNASSKSVHISAIQGAK